MTKPIIAVDIDGVLNDVAMSFAKLSNEYFGTKLTRDDFSEDMLRIWQIDSKELQRRINFLNKDGLWDNATLIRDDAFPVLNVLRRDYKLVVVTSRPRSLADQTAKTMDENFPGIFSEIIMPGIWDEIGEDIHERTKADICRIIGVDYLIDDQAKHCNAVAEIGAKSLLFGDEVWNRDEPIIDGVSRVDDWVATAKYFGV